MNPRVWDDVLGFGARRRIQTDTRCASDWIAAFVRTLWDHAGTDKQIPPVTDRRTFRACVIWDQSH